MNCPKCGSAIEEGKAYCSNPACGAVTGAAQQAPRRVVHKEINMKFVLDFTLFARAAAILIVLLATAYLYFFSRR